MKKILQNFFYFINENLGDTIMSKYHFIGIKGSGMSSLAQIAYDMGNDVQGSDEEIYFFTQEKLEQRNIPMY